GGKKGRPEGMEFYRGAWAGGPAGRAGGGPADRPDDRDGSADSRTNEGEWRQERMKILIRGAGDLATGIAARLYRCGHEILMTETEEPLTVRRTVAFSRAVYEGRAQVEDMEAVLAGNL